MENDYKKAEEYLNKAIEAGIDKELSDKLSNEIDKHRCSKCGALGSLKKKGYFLRK